MYRCASRAHGWLNGDYPSPSDDKVSREVCFTYNGTKCWQRTKIKMKNCGNFSVYLLNGMSYYKNGYFLRYCGVGETSEYFSLFVLASCDTLCCNSFHCLVIRCALPLSSMLAEYSAYLYLGYYLHACCAVLRCTVRSSLFHIFSH